MLGNDLDMKTTQYDTDIETYRRQYSKRLQAGTFAAIDVLSFQLSLGPSRPCCTLQIVAPSYLDHVPLQTS